VAGRPLRPATDRSLGGPLPRQQANPPQAPPAAAHSISPPPAMEADVCGLSRGFPRVSPTAGQVAHVLLTRPPLESRSSRVRLACLRCAASVCPEPGSNSPSQQCGPRPASVHEKEQGSHACASSGQGRSPSSTSLTLQLSRCLIMPPGVTPAASLF
jgi:hypothetical protein